MKHISIITLSVFFAVAGMSVFAFFSFGVFGAEVDVTKELSWGRTAGIASGIILAMIGAILALCDNSEDEE